MQQWWRKRKRGGASTHDFVRALPEDEASQREIRVEIPPPEVMWASEDDLEGEEGVNEHRRHRNRRRQLRSDERVLHSPFSHQTQRMRGESLNRAWNLASPGGGRRSLPQEQAHRSSLARDRHGSENTIGSQNSLASILSFNAKRVRSISTLFQLNSRHHHHDDSESTLTDVSSYSEAEWSERIIARDNWYHQSTGQIVIDQVGTKLALREVYALYRDDWFHFVLTQRTWKLFVGLSVVYTAYLLFFAAMYFAIRDPFDPTCALDPREDLTSSFQMAFAFAVETAATSGYGLPSDDTTSYWQNCVRVPVVVWWQSFFGILLNALIISLVVTRVGRADTRGHQVVFSNKACIIHRDGKFFFSFQCYDLDLNAPIVEAHVRCYTVLNESDGNTTANFQTRHMRLINPNDETGSSLFLSVPCIVVHEIDQWSPLLPPILRREHWHAHDDGFVHNFANRYQYPNLALREADSSAESRSGAQCPVCGWVGPTDEHLLRHVRYAQFMENMYLKESNDDDEENSEGKDPHSTESPEDDGSLPKLPPPKLNVLRNSKQFVSSPVVGSRKEYTQENDITGAVLQRGDDFQFERHAKTASHHERHHHHHHHSSFHQNARSRSMHQKLERQYEQQIKRGTSKRIRHHKTVKLRSHAKIDDRLKELSDLNKTSGHNGLSVEALISHDRVTLDATNQKKKSFGERLRERSASAGRHGSRGESSLMPTNKHAKDVRDAIEHFLESSQLEIICIVEGIEPQSSATFQARHSYTVDDIMFDHWFVECFGTDPKNPSKIAMDMQNFHEVAPLAHNQKISVQAIL